LEKEFFYSSAFCCLVLVVAALADENKTLLGDYDDGSRAAAVHLIPLLNSDGDKILPTDKPLMPFSTRQTCGGCHNYDKISKGWHFNAIEPNVDPGRVGQPWIFVDPGIATQIPLSYRPWPGTFRPKQIGLSNRQFVNTFGRQTPGGGPGEADNDNPNDIMRWMVSGKLEINCMSCHSAAPAYDQAEYATQIALENFRWAATAASPFASVDGSAKAMPDTWDPLMPGAIDNPQLRPPAVTYNNNAFDEKNRVFFDVVKKIPNKRCYFCHSNKDVGQGRPETWAMDEDVHLAAGLSCVDCHRNGLQHNITRGYENEASVSTNPLAAASSCKGCHQAGRLGAPVPKHRGIPAEHFDKLTCTACHSGPWPPQKTYRTKTARAHGLGLHTVYKSDDVLPHIFTPVFAPQRSDGKITVNKLFWPAFWAWTDSKMQQVTPIPLQTLNRTARKIIAQKKLARPNGWPALNTQHITEILKLLSAHKTAKGKPVYICGGKLYTLDDKGKLTAAEHDFARPYLWPIAHDVRPAAQALGAGGCEDCHSTDAAFCFGDVTVDSPLASDRRAVRKMVEFQKLDPLYMRLFAMSFVFRPWLKFVAIASCAVLGAVLTLYAFKALAWILKIPSEKD